MMTFLLAFLTKILAISPSWHGVLVGRTLSTPKGKFFGEYHCDIIFLKILITCLFSTEWQTKKFQLRAITEVPYIFKHTYKVSWQVPSSTFLTDSESVWSIQELDKCNRFEPTLSLTRYQLTMQDRLVRRCT